MTVFVPYYYAMSGGTLIALAADEIVMDENAVLGPVDPQIGQHPAASILTVVEQKNINEVSDETLILADIARKAIRQVRNSVKRIVSLRLEVRRLNDWQTFWQVDAGRMTIRFLSKKANSLACPSALRRRPRFIN